MKDIYAEFDQAPEADVSPEIKSMYDSFDGYDEKTTREKQIESSEWYNDPMMASRMVIDGMTLGWGDEVGAGVAAAAAKIGGDEKPYTEIYRDIKNAIDTEETQYRSDHPVASTALNVAGGFATGGVGGTKAAAKPLTTALIGGAIAGGGSAKEGETLKGAAVGSLFGLGTGTLMKGGGWLWNGATKRKIAQELGEGDNFIPIHFAANSADATEGTIGSFYKSVVGTSFGGGTKLKGQEERIINPIAARLNNARAAYTKAVDNSKAAVKRVNENMAKVKNAKLETIAEKKAAAKAALSGEQVTIKESFKGAKDQALLNATKEIDESVSAAERAFRGQAILKSIPEGQTDDVIDDILSSKTPNIAMQKLDDIWVRDGFNMLKGRKFQINANSVGNEIKANLKNDFAAMDKGSFQKIINDVTDFLGERTSKGWIDGDDLSAIRSRLGMLANAKSDAGGVAATEQAIFKSMQDVLNKRVKSQLSGKALKAFENHTAQWKANSTLRGAVNSASKRAGAQGEFTADDWVASIAKQSARDARQGKGVLRAEADNVAKLGVQRDKSIQEATNLVVSRAQKQKMNSLKTAINKTKNEINTLEKEAAKIKGRSGQTAAMRKAENARELAEKKQKISSLEGSINSLQKASSTDEATTFTRLAATYALGLGFGAGNLVTGSALSRGVASPGFQRTLAGQTGVQQSLNQFGNKVGQPLLQGSARNAGLISDPNYLRDRYIPIE